MKYFQLLSRKTIYKLILVCLILSACGPTSNHLPTPVSTGVVTSPSITETITPATSPTQKPTFTQIVNTLTPTPTQVVNTPTPLPTFTAATAKATLVASFHQIANAFPFQIVETDRGLADVTHVRTDYAAADRYHSIAGRDSNPTQDETITIGTKTWWKIKGEWASTPSGTLPQNNFWGLIPKAQDVTYSGQDTVAGVKCFVFSFMLNVQATGLYLSGNGQAWIGVSDGLPYQLDFTPTGNTTGTPTHQVYTYGITVDIQQPVP